jgi:hypothetical protein
MNQCIACGMPMVAPEEFAAGDVTKDYCVHCARPDGSLRSWDEAVIGMSGFLANSQGLDPEAARTTAIRLMAKLPAWQGVAVAAE